MRDPSIVVIIIGCLVLFVGGILAGCDLGIKYMRAEAVETGVAEWQVVDIRGNTEFKWKTLPTAEDCYE